MAFSFTTYHLADPVLHLDSYTQHTSFCQSSQVRPRLWLASFLYSNLPVSLFYLNFSLTHMQFMVIRFPYLILEWNHVILATIFGAARVKSFSYATSTISKDSNVLACLQKPCSRDHKQTSSLGAAHHQPRIHLLCAFWAGHIPMQQQLSRAVWVLGAPATVSIRPPSGLWESYEWPYALTDANPTYMFYVGIS